MATSSSARERRLYPSVPVVEGLDPSALRRDFLAQNQPVVARLGDARAWLDRWQPEALCARFGDATIDTEETREVYVGERALRPRPLEEAVRGMLAGDTALRWKGLEFLRKVPAMRADLEAQPAPYRALLPAGSHSFRDTLWIAPRGTMSSLHHDGDFDNLNLQIAGRKLFLLIPPPHHRALYAYGSAESPLNPFVPDLGRFPRFGDVPAVEAMLAPGDVLLVPKYWWHCVYAFEPSVNLSTHFGWEGELPAWGVLDGAPLVHRSLTVVAAAMKRRRLHRLADATRRLWYAGYTRVVPRIEPQPRCELVG